MEIGYAKADSRNLPKLSYEMLGAFWASNPNFCSSEFRNVKSAVSSRPSYGDDAVGYVQVKRQDEICTLLAKVCPEHKVRAKPYAVSLVVDEVNDVIKSVQCHDCVASQGGCKHAMAFLKWVHRRSEEPSCTSVECYWRKAKLTQIGTGINYKTAKEMCKGACPSIASNNRVAERYREEGAKRNIHDSEYLKYSQNVPQTVAQGASLHQLVVQHQFECCDTFLANVMLTDDILKSVEEITRDQHKNSLWYELRYGRITASRAFEVSRCQTFNGTLIAAIMGGKIPDTSAMERGRRLEDSVKKVVETKLKKKIQRCGLLISKNYPMIAGSPDGIGDNFIIEIKCPTTEKACHRYIKDGKPTSKFYAQTQIQMFLSSKKLCFFCVADPQFTANSEVTIVNVDFEEDFVNKLIQDNLIPFWKNHVFPLLYKCVAPTK